MYVQRFKPQCTVKFYTETSNLVARATNDPHSRFDDDIVSVETFRDMGADAPTFRINLTRRKKWHKWIASNDLVTIEMVRPPENSRVVFIGLVDDIRKRVSLEGDKPQRVITVTGRGFSKAFIQFDIGTVPSSVDAVTPSIGWLAAANINFTNSPADKILDLIWENLATKFVNYKFSDDRRLFDIAQKSFTSRQNAIMVSSAGLTQYNGSMWAFFKEISDQPFNELFWETDGANPILTLRPTPFNKEDWDALPIYSISDGDVVMEEYGRSDVETYTIFQVGMRPFTSSRDVTQTVGLFPYWYEPYADKYGIRRLYVESLYTAWSQNQDNEKVKNDLAQRQKDIFNWYIKNNQYYNGTLGVMGMARYKVGTRLVYTSVEDESSLEFYIRSVGHRFINYGNWITTLGIIRGSEPSERFSEPVGKFEEYKGTKWSPFQLNPSYTPADGSLYPVDGAAAGKVIEAARSILGKIQYAFGGVGIEGGAGDCSQFTQWAYKQAGVAIGRSTGDQVQQGRTIMDRSQLQAGDLVFFTGTYPDSPHPFGVTHVGIYSGGGNVIHHGGGMGPVEVSLEGLISSIERSGGRYFRAQRILTDDVTSDGGSGGKMIMGIKFTAYGNSLESGGSGDGLTASGTAPVEGRTIAVDPRVVTMGSRVKVDIPGYPELSKVYIAEDVGGAIKGNRVDIYFNDMPPMDVQKAVQRMNDFGVQYGNITILS